MFVYLAKGDVNHACDIIMNDCVREVSAYTLSTRVLSVSEIAADDIKIRRSDKVI